MADETYLNSRGLFSSVFPKDAKTISVAHSLRKKMPIPFSLTNPPQRKLKSKYVDKEITLSSNDEDEVGFSFMFKIEGSSGNANLYVLCELGQPITFSYEIGGDTFTFPASNQIDEITINKNNSISFIVNFGNADVPYDDIPAATWSQTIGISTTNKAADDGYYGKLSQGASENAWNDSGVSANIVTQIIITSDKNIRFNFNTMEYLAQFMLAKNDADSIADTAALLKNLYNGSNDIKYYYTQDSFLGMNNPDKFLLQEDVAWANVKDFDTENSYIVMTLDIDGSTNATDNYTGFNADSSKRLEKIILPQELSRLSPQDSMAEGIVFCGGENSKITEAKYENGNALFSFRDSSQCVIPHPEHKTFIAKDTSTQQILKGKVINMEKKSGNPIEAERELLAIRKKQNINNALSFEIDGKEVLDSIAWITGEKSDYIKLIVPDGDNTKIITINIGEL
jgi:hypothetical protein